MFLFSQAKYLDFKNTYGIPIFGRKIHFDSIKSPEFCLSLLLKQ